ncbi:hypothetical protein [Bradyrhizobium sp. DASA03120]|uniref:hypothetical protein n=1 Tax=Bradyrhizobium sp. SMVTL-02 TaxID=3395917 RepID=UPI003F7009D5
MSEAFDLLCARLAAERSGLPDLCGRFDELMEQGERVDMSDDPHRRLFELECTADWLFRSVLRHVELRAFIDKAVQVLISSSMARSGPA